MTLCGRFRQRGRPAREGAPLPVPYTNFPFTEQVKIANLGLVGLCLPASQSLVYALVCTPIRRGLPFARAKGSKTRSGRPRDPRRLAALDTDIIFLRQQKNKFVQRADALKKCLRRIFIARALEREGRTTTPLPSSKEGNYGAGEQILLGLPNSLCRGESQNYNKEPIPLTARTALPPAVPLQTAPARGCPHRSATPR